ncbi:AAA family ATPase [Phytoactinopolyspora mesophila]|uniref:AAA family ATPase n=1 Tax=Phytoactinopolyspora mesophila TaxID=2650750 RepID=A0A7K3MAK7_9ACTN|nr:AAA family ATPase [Phytoactinopolyspora mesophila]NDL60323.1 AAA family ATPase [Phytoactinopolyspora mesophila]
MIVWLNGTFGAGKTTAAEELVEVMPDARTFDPECVGFMLRRFITEPVGDFQDWPAWRALVTETAHQILQHYGGTLVVPMTLLRREYANEIFAGLREHGIDVRHVLLHVDDDELVRRIESDQVESGARDWRLEHISPYRDALAWLRDDAAVVDTTHMAPVDVAQKVVGLL